MHIVLDGGFCFSEAPWLSWTDIQYGLERGFLSTQGVVEFAVNSLSADAPAEQYELACLSDDDVNDVKNCVTHLAAKDIREFEDTKKAWMFLVFLWVFKNKDRYQDSLGVAEELYADFDYPDSISPIIRYMPSANASLEGEDQLFKNWFHEQSFTAMLFDVRKH